MPIDPTIKHCIEAYRSLILAKSYAEELKKEVKKERERLNSINRLIHRSEEKLDTLKNPIDVADSLRLFFTNKEHQLELERERYHDLILNYNTGLKFIEISHFDLEILGKKIEKEAQLKTSLREQIKFRKDQLSVIEPQRLQEVLRLLDKLDNRIALKREITETLDVGTRLLEALTKGILFLEKKASSSTPLERGSIYDFNLLQLEELQQIAVLIKKLLIEYESEVKDIYQHIKLDKVIKIDNLFIEELLDLIKTDFLLNSNLESSISYLKLSRQRIRKRQLVFEKDEESLHNFILQLEEEFDECLLVFEQ